MMSDNFPPHGEIKEIPFMDLSGRARSLWAKVSSEQGNISWLPLAIHMSDTFGMGRKMRMDWIPYSTKAIIVNGIMNKDGSKGTFEEAERLLDFLTAVHDVGKAMPAFQGQTIFQNPDVGNSVKERINNVGLYFRDDLTSPRVIPHSWASETILERNGVDRSVSVVAGGHHGKPPSESDLNRKIQSYSDNTGFRKSEWLGVQDEILGYALYLSGTSIEDIRSIKLSAQAQIVLTGILIMADWMASDERRFPYKEEFDYKSDELTGRADSAWNQSYIPYRWEAKEDWKKDDLYKLRFGRESLRPFQRTVFEISKSVSKPGLMIIEAPMGEGKTEAALVAAEIMAQKFGQSGILFALPTRATADGIFPRIIEWVESAIRRYDPEEHSLFLAHGKSHYNKVYREIPKVKWSTYGDSASDATDNLVVHEWFSGRKKGLLSDFVVGTVDQVLFGGLKQKHLAMRHLSLANKVVIIDECHAYDEYMGNYLCKIMQWLGSYNVPVIVLSATLPPLRRKELISAYLNEEKKRPTGEEPWISNEAYPVVTYTDGTEVKQAGSERSGRAYSVEVSHISDGDLISCLDTMAGQGGYIGIIVNTVKRAQDISRMIKNHFKDDTVHLLHSGFTSIDRTYKESETLKMLHKDNRIPAPHRVFTVGTQVIEQSLDLDFDLLITDLCPMDLMLQRMGRLHRHNNIRPDILKKAHCIVLDTGTGPFEEGSKHIYGKYQLMNTRVLLPDVVNLPEDIPKLVHKAYSADGVDIPADLCDEYAIAKNEMQADVREKNREAETFQIKSPNKTKNLIGWLDSGTDDDISERSAEATVRDTGESIEAILVQRHADGKFYVLPWVEDLGGAEIPSDSIPLSNMAFTLAGCKVRLPGRFSAPYRIAETIKELERINSAELPRCWQESDWLRGELFMVLDDDYTARFLSFRLTYDRDYGLTVVTDDDKLRI